MKWMRYVANIRGLVSSLIVLAVFCVLAYLLCCTQASQLSELENQQSVVLAGLVTSSHHDAAQGASIFELEDPSGRVFVVTNVGPPDIGAFVIVWGAKATTDTERPLVLEQKRVGSF